MSESISNHDLELLLGQLNPTETKAMGDLHELLTQQHPDKPRSVDMWMRKALSMVREGELSIHTSPWAMKDAVNAALETEHDVAAHGNVAAQTMGIKPRERFRSRDISPEGVASADGMTVRER